MKRVLIIDDSPFIAKEIGDIIEQKGYEVAGHAKNGELGIQMNEELKPDVITLDIIMPGIDGIETAQAILSKYPDTKIVMLSSLCDHDTMEEIEELGLKYLVAKPIEPDKLIEALDAITAE